MRAMQKWSAQDRSNKDDFLRSLPVEIFLLYAQFSWSNDMANDKLKSKSPIADHAASLKNNGISRLKTTGPLDKQKGRRISHGGINNGRLIIDICGKSP